ncbi:MAG TPA: hypothetical protein PLL69_10550, partial [Gemmatimonadales bacterium]|nr:hypothetical protein [Gemmatimonadales bacterium]
PNPEFGVGFGAGILGNSGFKLDTDLLFELLRPGERDGRVGVATATIAASRADILAREYEVAAGVRRMTFEVLIAEQVTAVLDEGCDAAPPRSSARGATLARRTSWMSRQPSWNSWKSRGTAGSRRSSSTKPAWRSTVPSVYRPHSTSLSSSRASPSTFP